MRLQEIIVLLFVTLAVAVEFVTCQNNGTVANECRIVPSAGACRNNPKRTYWSYSTKTNVCTQVYGCYSVRDRNVFLTKDGCERTCFAPQQNPNRPPVPLPGVPGVRVAQSCRLNPSPGRCDKNGLRSFWSYSGKTGTCIQVTGCYTLSDRNIFTSRDQCRRECLLTDAATTNTNSAVTLPAAGRPVTLPSGVKIDPECRVNPSQGTCRPNARRNWYSFSAKTSSCVQIYGCYDVRDRNVFMDRNRCRQKCLASGIGPGQEWKRDSQCYLNPTAGRCAASERRSFWSYSSKLKTCTQIYGCYGLRDRNVFQTQDSCNRMCVGNQMTPEVLPEGGEKFTTTTGMKIALECRINPSPGRCTNGEKRSFYSYSSKTGDCAKIFGCYGVRDRNVFMTQSNCRRGCFISDSDSASGMEPQCYINPSAGRCAENQKTRYWTHSSKTGGCVQIYGCYSIRDRNVFLSKKGCEEACGAPSTLPVQPDGQVNVECMVNPTQGRCRDSAKRQYYSYSSKTGTCLPIFGCYGLRDRNVFLTLDGCNTNCFVTNGGTNPPGQRDNQCYLVPSPGRCLPNQRRVYYSYSPKVDNCAQLTGCYSIRDRNVFVTRKSCVDACGILSNSTNLLPDGPVAMECQLNPSPGRCLESEKRRYYTYSGKTQRCSQIYGCYSIRDRNVFLTEDGCRKNCFKTGDPSGERDRQCMLVPAQGRCRENEKTNYWSYSPKINGCTQIYGCYSIRDRNVFMTRASCRQICAVNRNATFSLMNNVKVSLECRVNPSQGQCRPGDNRRYYSYSSKTSSCVQIDGCYSIRDRNVFLSRQACRDNCFISNNGTPSSGKDQQCFLNPAAGVCLESQKRNYWSYSPKIDACTQIYGCYSVRDRNIFLTRDQCGRICDTNTTIDVPINNATVAIECLVNPSPANCRDNQRTRYYTYNAKTGTCTQLYGCYSIRDRNVFLTETGCNKNCFSNTPSGGRDNQCYLTPSPGRCMESQKRSYWTFSSKLEACTQIYGCYSLRDRNVYTTRPSCENVCAVDAGSAFINDISNVTIARECRMNPSPGVCRANERTRYFTFSSKTNTCMQIYGCYSARDRNVFLTRENCRQNCFITDGNRPNEGRDNQCYINPSPGRCSANERRTYWTFSAKVEGCVEIFGCYSPRDRNVYLTRSGCRQTCSVNRPIINPNDNSNVAIECRLNPTPGTCRDNERTRYYTYSGKTGTCIQIFGCYSIRDRNVFLTRENCRQNCLGGGGRPTDRPDNQCYLNPTPGQCLPNERRTYWTYSSKTGACERIYGCYSIRDRNVYITQNSCQQTCIVYIRTTTMYPPINPTPVLPTVLPTKPPNRVSVECLFNPSPGICRDVDKRQYYSYSTKTQRCVPIYGCYGPRDRNVFMNMDRCNRNCFISDEGQLPREKDPQCFINPSPGRCNPSDRRTYFTYSSKTASCVQIYGCYSVRDRNVFMARGGCRRACVNGDFSNAETLPALTDITTIRLEDGLRLSRECQINPTPGFCAPRQERTFWSFSTKTMGCTRITGCYDIHDRNTWLTQDGCRRNCFKNDSAPVVPGVTPLECMLNPTPGRCLPSERRTYWSYNNKLNTCRQITGCYDFHDRNVWASLARCQTKCRSNAATIQPLMPGSNIDTVVIAKECHVNPSPGRCLESEKLTYWSFSVKTGTCVRIRGCYSIRDRNTWLTRESCRSNCIIMDPSKPDPDKVPLGCKLIPTPGRCLESQRKLVWTYSEKLGACIEIIGCYDFHDRNVWRTRKNCDEKCHVTTIPIFPDMSEYDVDLECQLNPSPGMCRESEQRSFYAFSTKAMSCVEIYGCYTMNDRNVWFSRQGCLNNCLVPKSDNSTSRPVAAGCRITATVRPCQPGQKTNWWTYDDTTEQCVNVEGCYRLGDRNVFLNKQRCEVNCFRNTGPNQDRRECYMNPAPGVCRDDERRIYWSYNKKTSTCMRVEGCYSIRDRNVWLTENMCKNSCIRLEITSNGALPDFMSSASIPRITDDGRGRRGRVASINRDGLTTSNNDFVRIVTSNNLRSTNTLRNSNTLLNRAQGVTGSQASVVDVSRSQSLDPQMTRLSEGRSNSVRVVQVSGNGVQVPSSKVVTSLFRT